MKICVFCNKKPVNKNNEHVIPEWLIEMTGGENRPLYLAKEDSYFNPHSMGSLVFPACTSCNSQCSILEGKAKKIAISMTKAKDLSGEDFEIFFDWMDKVRVGLNLGFIMKTKNRMEIKPQYGVSTRDKTDRILFIERFDYDKPSLLFTGYNDPLFHWLPSFFGLYFNGILIFSASNAGLLSNKTILPSLEEPKTYEGRKFYTTLNFKPNRKAPIPFFGKNTTVIAEVNYNVSLPAKRLSLEQVKLMKQDLSGSKILIKKAKHFALYSSSKSGMWKKNKIGNKYDMFKRFYENFPILRRWVAEENFLPERIKALQKELIKKFQPLPLTEFLEKYQNQIIVSSQSKH